MIFNAFTFFIARTVAQNRGVPDAEATRLGLVGAVLRPAALGIVAASAIASSEAPSGLLNAVAKQGHKPRQGNAHPDAASKAAAAKIEAEEKEATATAKAKELVKAVGEAKAAARASAEALKDEIAAREKEAPQLGAELKEAEAALRRETEAETAAKEAAKAAAKAKAAGR
jgi:hypothetical protein